MNFGEGCLLTNTQIIQSGRSGGTSIETWQKVHVYSQQYTTVREDQSLQGYAHVLGKELINPAHSAYCQLLVNKPLNAYRKE